MADYQGKYTGGGIERILDLSDPYIIPDSILNTGISDNERFELLGGEEGVNKLFQAISSGKRLLLSDGNMYFNLTAQIVNSFIFFKSFYPELNYISENRAAYGDISSFILEITGNNEIGLVRCASLDSLLQIDGTGDKALFNDGTYKQIQISSGGTIGSADISTRDLRKASEGNSDVISKLESMPDGIYLTEENIYHTHGILYIYGTHAYGTSSSEILRIYRLEDSYLDTTILAKIQYTEESDVIYKLYSSYSKGHQIYAKDFSDNEYSLFVYGDTELSIYSANNNSTIQIVYDENVKNNPIIRIGSVISEARDFYIKFAKNESGNIQSTGNPISIHLEYDDDIYLRLNTSFGFAERIYPINI